MLTIQEIAHRHQPHGVIIAQNRQHGEKIRRDRVLQGKIQEDAEYKRDGKKPRISGKSACRALFLHGFQKTHPLVLI
ncbi:MAG: hypothetical protein JXR14_15795 [Paracoccaceae bacterium]